MMPIAPVRATCVPPQADRSKSVDVDQPQRALARRIPCAAAARAASSGVGEPDRRPADPPRRSRLASSSARAISAGVTSRARSMVDDVGAEMEAHGADAAAADRTPPTARAGRCAAACDRSGAPSRSRRARAPAVERRDRRTCTMPPSSASTTSSDARAAERAGVERLPAGRRIERGPIEDAPRRLPS